jgi:mannose-6-phosphate isomerase-like protein (cupin superfamily)
VNNISPASGLRAAMQNNIGRHVSKSFDWAAFPGNIGFPALERAQMRYVGGGGSPKVGEPGVIKPEHFTVSLVHKPVGNFAACHSHEVDESFLILSGVLTVGWFQDGDVVEIRLGPKDMIVNAPDIGHGFRNDGVEPVLMSITVDAGKPLPPRYLFHPKNGDSVELSAKFGAQEGKTIAYDPQSAHPLQQLLSKYVMRFVDAPTIWEGAGFTRKVYVGEGGVKSDAVRKEMLGVPPGVGVKPYERDVEDAFLVLEGSLTVGWQDGGESVEIELGPRDLLVTPAGRKHWFRNNSAGACTVWSLVGSPGAETVAFERS